MIFYFYTFSSDTIDGVFLCEEDEEKQDYVNDFCRFGGPGHSFSGQALDGKGDHRCFGQILDGPGTYGLVFFVCHFDFQC